jgi:hypothetical protein
LSVRNGGAVPGPTVRACLAEGEAGAFDLRSRQEHTMRTQTHRKPARAAVPAALLPDGGDMAAVPTSLLADGQMRDELIRQRAYERYERNGCVEGHALDDWLAAEDSLGPVAQP